MSEQKERTAIVIDDVPSMRGMMKLMLNGTGCEVVGEAEDGRLGLQLYRDIRPDLVLLDVDMPVMDGISTLKAILEEDPQAQVIMITTVTNWTIAESCLMAGAKDYITKDKKPQIIRSRLQEVIAGLTE